MIMAIDTETYEYNEAQGEYTPVLNARKFVIGCARIVTGKQSQHIPVFLC